MMFTRIHFDTVPATDVGRARDFYRDKLGFTVERDNPYGVPKTQTPALVLVTDDVDAACATLKSRGVPIKRGPDDAPWEPGTRWAMIDDSEGNLVLIQTVA